ncbi:lactonase family protein [Nocardia sp. NPDC052112]|uniref:lactonase family protein n=1 Tax=Nocardia sp. NPDC052112 TaxID=3155646 RepID=UPI003449FD66
MPSITRRGFLTAAAGVTGTMLVAACTTTKNNQENKTVIAYVGSRTTVERQARGKGISTYSIDAQTGQWTQVQQIETVNPAYLTLDRSQRFLYAVHGDGTTVSAYTIDPANGSLTPLNEQDTGGKNPAHIVADPANRFVIVSNHSSGSVVTLPIQPDGSLGPVTGKYELPGTPGPHRIDQTGSKPHQVVFDPQNQFMIVPDKGLDRIFVLRLDTANGQLVQVSSVATREATGPRHVAFHRKLPYLYCIDELRSTVTTYHWDQNQGQLQPIQILSSSAPTFTTDTRGGEIVVGADGNYVYATNRSGAGDSTPGGPDPDTIGIFRVDPETGLLTAISWQPTQGIRPRFACLGPDKTMIYAANERSDSIIEFHADGDKLTPTGQTVATGSPTCIAFRTTNS